MKSVFFWWIFLIYQAKILRKPQKYTPFNNTLPFTIPQPLEIDFPPLETHFPPLEINSQPLEAHPQHFAGDLQALDRTLQLFAGDPQPLEIRFTSLEACTQSLEADPQPFDGNTQSFR